MSQPSITTLTHPDYSKNTVEWEMYRYILDGGSKFVNRYLEQYSTREDPDDFNKRKKITYCPGYAKEAIQDIRNAIHQRLVDVAREGGADSYIDACKGKNGGVDHSGSSMNTFIGNKIILELIGMSKVGVFIDRDPTETLPAVGKGPAPYLYTYTAENIKAWTFDKENNLTSVLLKNTVDDIDEDTGLVKGTKDTYQLLRKVSILDESKIKIEVRYFDDKSKELVDQKTYLDLPEIPFVIFEISTSLLVDIARYQVALLNIESSDVNYIWKANFPFYTEQYDPNIDNPHIKGWSDDAGTATEANTSNTPEIKVGTLQGRKYPKGMDRPGFIHPSSEPLKASIEKCENMKMAIRQLVSLALTNIEPRFASAESKKLDQSGLEAGLSNIGLEIEHGERKIAKIWAAYEGKDTATTINYPQKYSLKTDEERFDEAQKLKELMHTMPSITFQRVIAKQIIITLLSPRVSDETLKKMLDEVDNAVAMTTDPDIIRQDADAGLVSLELASKIRFYPAGEVEKAKKEHMERATRIAMAQSDAAARGVVDMSSDPTQAAKMDKASIDATN